jgi:hypothetical protein
VSLWACNGCGSLCAKVSPADGKFSDYGLVGAEVTGGYLSTYLRDCVRYRFSLCEACLVQLFDGFAVPPQVDHVDGDQESTTWAEDRRARTLQQIHEARWDAWRCPKCSSPIDSSISGRISYERWECARGHAYVALRVLGG